MELYLFRHGIAEEAAPGQSDATRALTGEGRKKTAGSSGGGAARGRGACRSAARMRGLSRSDLSFLHPNRIAADIDRGLARHILSL
jgi:hypothetical protein